jgi:hypothetical protein
VLILGAQLWSYWPGKKERWVLRRGRAATGPAQASYRAIEPGLGTVY